MNEDFMGRIIDHLQIVNNAIRIHLLGFWGGVGLFFDHFLRNQ